ncbi:MAG: hypothetical protein OXR62_14760 [Ahrensia sp.]|nr:hypothetical protein [Ahrensia sp.]
MLLEQSKELDELILAEKRRVAQELFEEAWDHAQREGIEPSILADQAISIALRRLCSLSGESNVNELVAALPDRVKCGHFLVDRVLQ